MVATKGVASVVGVVSECRDVTEVVSCGTTLTAHPLPAQVLLVVGVVMTVVGGVWVLSLSPLALALK